ncbi:MAG: IS110 family transposase [Roseivirga sp.]
MEKRFIGIDVDKHTLKVCLVFQDTLMNRKVKATRTFKNTKQGFAELLSWAANKVGSDHRVDGFVLEATGTYHEQLIYFLHRHDQTVHVVLPLLAKHYMRSIGQRSKNDKADAMGLAMMGCERNLERWVPACEYLLELRSLTRLIERLQNQKTAFYNHLEAYLHAEIVHPMSVETTKKLIKELEKQIDQAKQEVSSIIKTDPVLKAKFNLFKDLKGIGLMSFAVVVSETNGFTLFKNQRQLVSYAGYDILENSSGKKVGKTRISKKGNTHIRRVLYLAALSALTHQAELKNLHTRVYNRTAIKMKGVVAVQRKLLVLMYTIWKKDQAFVSNYQHTEDKEHKPSFR